MLERAGHVVEVQRFGAIPVEKTVSRGQPRKIGQDELALPSRLEISFGMGGASRRSRPISIISSADNYISFAMLDSLGLGSVEVIFV